MNYEENIIKALVKSLLWCRRYHKLSIEEADKKLKEISKKYDIEIPLE